MHREHWVVAVSLVLFSSCSQGPAPPERPSVWPRSAANKAISLYDANDDSKLDLFEIAKSPTLLVAQAQIDADKDGTINAQEIAAHIRGWQHSNTILIATCPTIMLDGEPLAGATVTLEPAPFLGSGYPSTSAVTDSKGQARFVGSDRRYPGVYVGLYQVRVSKIEDDKEIIPARYNSETTLALEVSQERWIDTIFTWFYLDSK